MKGALTTYIRFIDYSANVLTTEGTHVPYIVAITDLLDTSSTQL